MVRRKLRLEFEEEISREAVLGELHNANARGRRPRKYHYPALGVGADVVYHRILTREDCLNKCQRALRVDSGNSVSLGRKPRDAKGTSAHRPDLPNVVEREAVKGAIDWHRPEQGGGGVVSCNRGDALNFCYECDAAGAIESKERERVGAFQAPWKERATCVVFLDGTLAGRDVDVT